MKEIDTNDTRIARVDKWLWAVRLFKTRSQAAEACKKGQVAINDKSVKPARTVKAGDTVSVKRAPVTYSFRVVQAIEKRVGAKLVPEMMENITSPEQYELLEMNRISGFVDRQRGSGRPTKKERRSLDDFMDVPLFWDGDEME